MQRRRFLQTGVFGGTLALGAQLATEPPVDAAGGVKSRFFEGSLIGGPLGGFALQIGVAAARTRGTATPAGTEDALDIVPMSGMLLGNNLTLTIYSAASEGDPVEIGTLSGTLRGKSLKGSYALKAGGTGTFASKLITGNKKSMKKLSGVYEGRVNFLDAYSPGWSGVTTVKPNGNWELTDVKRPDGTDANVRFAGIYVIPSGRTAGTAAGGPKEILAMLLPHTSKGIRGLAACDCACCDGGDKDGDGVGDVDDDSDSDGIPDRDDKDWDNDGKDDDVDLDDDNDGKPDDQDPNPFTDQLLEGKRRAMEAQMNATLAAIRASQSARDMWNLSMNSPYAGGPPIIATGNRRR